MLTYIIASIYIETALLLGISGAGKLVSRHEVEDYLRTLGFREAYLPALWASTATLELILALCPLLAKTRVFTSLMSAGVFLVFSLLQAHRLKHLPEAPCACFGRLSRKPATSRDIFINLTFSLANLSVFAYEAFAPTHWATTPSSKPGEVAFFLFLLSLSFLCLFFLIQYGKEAVRVALKREENDEPKTGSRNRLCRLPIGHDLPSIEVAVQGSRAVPLATFTSGNKASLLIFTEEGCSFCDQIIDELPDWPETQASPKLIVVSSHSIPNSLDGKYIHVTPTGQHPSPAERVGIDRFPSALLISGSGEVLSEVVSGKDRIRNLYGHLNGDISNRNALLDKHVSPLAGFDSQDPIGILWIDFESQHSATLLESLREAASPPYYPQIIVVAYNLPPDADIRSYFGAIIDDGDHMLTSLFGISVLPAYFQVDALYKPASCISIGTRQCLDELRRHQVGIRK